MTSNEERAIKSGLLKLCQELRERSSGMASCHHDDLDFIAYVVRNAYFSSSQLFQDLWVLYELKEKRDGYFVEIGACDGRFLSNSYILEVAFGWNGVLAEPGRIWHNSLMQNRSCFISRDCVFSQTGQTVGFNETSQAELSTIDAFTDNDHHAAARVSGSRYEVNTISLRDLLICARAPKEIDYLSVDTEGSELDILTAFDFEEYKIAAITVEHNYTPRREKLFEFLMRQGYKRKLTEYSKFDDWYIRV